MSISSPTNVTPLNNSPFLDTTPRPFKSWRSRAKTGLVVTLVGFVIFLLGARPSLFGLDRSPVVGFVQIAVFLVGLAIISVGGYTGLMALWKGHPVGIPAEIGQRLVATGYVIAVFSGMADIFGMGSHPLPGVPFFGPLQALGVEIGQLLIAVGLIMLIPFGGAELKDK
jgi:hypothetical protein